MNGAPFGPCEQLRPNPRDRLLLLGRQPNGCCHSVLVFLEPIAKLIPTSLMERDDRRSFRPVTLVPSPSGRRLG